MQRLNAPNQNKGFTLIEVIVTVIIAGVLAAITAPSLVGLLNQNQVKEAQRQVESALKEAQRQAKRRGKSCSITISPSAKTISSADNCLLSTRTIGDSNLVGSDTLSLIVGSNNNADETITFNNKGGTTASKTIVVNSSSSSEVKCVFISSISGSIRSGNYTASTAVGTALVEDSCLGAD